MNGRLEQALDMGSSFWSWFRSHLELQAITRAQRIGQRREKFVDHFMAEA